MQDGQEEQARTASDAAAKAIGDLDALVQAVLTSLPPLKPWQRQLLAQLREIDRATQVLRMTIALGRVDSEVTAAKQQVLTALRAANHFVGMGRADLGTRAAVRLAFDIGKRIDQTVA